MPHEESYVDRRKILIFPLVLMIFIILIISLSMKLEGNVISYGNMITVTRTLTPTGHDNVIDVVLSIDFNEGRLPDGISIQEYIPSGWLFMNSTLRLTHSYAENNLYIWNFSKTPSGVYDMADGGIFYSVKKTTEDSDFKMKIVEYIKE